MAVPKRHTHSFFSSLVNVVLLAPEATETCFVLLLDHFGSLLGKVLHWDFQRQQVGWAACLVIEMYGKMQLDPQFDLEKWNALKYRICFKSAK